jgi:hypothetical protein
MSENENFVRLVSEMTLEERKSLLDRISVQSNISKDPLYEERTDPPPIDVEEKYGRLPWYFHVWFMLLSMFKTVSKVKLYEESQVNKVGKMVQVAAPGVYDYKRNMFLPLFYETLTEVRDGARFFYNALNVSINRDRGAFYSFLGSLEMPEIHERLQNQTNPHLIAKRIAEAKEADLRKIAFHDMSDILGEITQEQRNVMYNHARSLECLKELASFRFDKLLLSFTHDPVKQGHFSPAGAMVEPLEKLNNILNSFKEPPAITLIESLFVFILHEHIDEENASTSPNIDMEMRQLLVKAENALVAIRTFNKEVPLTLILRCAGRNMSLSTQQVTGGEDWFVVYHDYWRERIEEQLAEYRSMRRQEELLESLRTFFNEKPLVIMENVYTKTNPNPELLPISGTFSLSFLMTFYSAVFISDINNELRHILIDGKFSRRENRTVFTENYNNVIKLEDDIKLLDKKLSHVGEYGKRFALAMSENSLQMRRRKTQVIIDDASEEAEELVSRTKLSIEGLITMLSAIITKDSNGEYTTLINMNHFMAKEDTAVDLSILTAKGKAFIENVQGMIKKFQIVLSILEDIEVLQLDEQ